MFAALQDRRYPKGLGKAKFAIKRGLLAFGGPDPLRPLNYKGKKRLTITPKGHNYLGIVRKFGG